MEEAIEEGRHGRGVAEQLPPVVHGTIRREQRGRPFVAAHDELEEVLGGGVGEPAHAEVIDDEERHGGQLGEVCLAGVGEGGLGEFLEQDVASR